MIRSGDRCLSRLGRRRFPPISVQTLDMEGIPG